MTYSSEISEKDRKLYDAYISGDMSPEDAEQYKSFFESGEIKAPVDKLETPFLKRSIFDAYQSGVMPEDERLIVDEAVKRGEYRLPDAQSLPSSTFREETPIDIPSPQKGIKEERKEDPFFNKRYMEPAQELLGTTGSAASGLLRGREESPTYRTLQSTGIVPKGKGLVPEIGRIGYDTLSKFGDAGLLALSALGAAGAAAAGTIASAAGKYDQRLGRDIMALPEAFAGIGSVARAPSRIGRAPTKLEPYSPPKNDVATLRGIERAPESSVIKPTPPSEDIYPRSPVEKMDEVEFQETLNAASRGGNKAKVAQVKLAKELDLDPKVVETAERFDVDLPVAEMSRNENFQYAQSELRKSISNINNDWEKAQNQINKKMSNEIGKISEGKSISEISEGIKKDFNENLSKYKKLEKEARDKLSMDLKRDTPISPESTISYIEEKIRNLRGEKNLPNELRDLYKKALRGKIYEDIKLSNPVSIRDIHRSGIEIRKGKPVIKNSDAFTVENIDSNYIKPLNQKKFGSTSPWNNFSDFERDNLIQVLDQDMMNAAVKTGKWTPEQYTEMKSHTVNKKSYQERLSKLFDKDQQGDMASNIKSIITGATKGGIENLNDVLGAIPDNYRAPVISSSIREASVTKQGGVKHFNPSEFVNTMNLVRDQKPIYRKIREELGTKSMQIIEDIYTISNALHKSKQKGKISGSISSSDLKNNLSYDNFLTRIIENSVAQNISAALLGSAIGSAFGGSWGGALGMGIGIFGAQKLGQHLRSGRYSSAISRGFRMTHELLSSPEFKKLAVDIGKGADPVAASKKLAKSSKFRQYYNSLSDSAKRKGLEFGKRAGLDKEPRFREVYQKGGVSSGSALQLWILSQVYESRKEANRKVKDKK